MRVKYGIDDVNQAIARVRQLIDFHDGDVVLILMNGGAFFAHKVMSNEVTKLHVEYVKLGSYTGQHRGEIKEVYFPDLSKYLDRRVIVLDDICDSGNTLRYIHDKLKGLGFDYKQIRYFTLISRSGYKLYPDMVFTAGIEDHSEDFFLGMGMDSSEGWGRNLPFIGVEE